MASLCPVPACEGTKKPWQSVCVDCWEKTPEEMREILKYRLGMDMYGPSFKRHGAMVEERREFWAFHGVTL